MESYVKPSTGIMDGIHATFVRHLFHSTLSSWCNYERKNEKAHRNCCSNDNEKQDRDDSEEEGNDDGVDEV